ncbi:MULTISPECIES: hypothetical protein [Enterococcus]|uniref:Uncharacterized protein n=2 Tax=Enterococcus mundtii TaxID=53346 RepID=A0AAI8WAZ1_ENTMU|nr:hypothetical protein [Enterococcus mundtii]EOH65290.1 hypothetical protein UAC_00569 [Enterococcus mundtii ATCC 882]EOU14273.1 hypothetical protein I587_02872 [Enterococcus mundtii ATCC 882]MDY4306615.1 hypothetical protein [Enterococcus mundtii]MRI73220.1 hypothetical protein [Enterococcus mundtii]PJK26363.1 hypothetical protein CV769_05445 [Enterococcus mundtii]
MKNKKLVVSVIGTVAAIGVFVSIDQVSASEMNEPLIISSYANIFDMDIVQEQAVMIQPKITMDTFYGGVTGIPGFGTVWGEFTPSSRRVTVQAKGTKTVNVTGGPRVEVRAEAPRAFTGNTSGWWWA